MRVVDSTGLSQDLSLAIGDAVETWVLDACIVMGIAKRFVWDGPHLPFELATSQALAGCHEAYGNRPPLTSSMEKAADLTIRSIAAMMNVAHDSASDLWSDVFRSRFLGADANQLSYAYFGTLVANQNMRIVPIAEQLARRHRPFVFEPERGAT